MLVRSRILSNFLLSSRKVWHLFCYVRYWCIIYAQEMKNVPSSNPFELQCTWLRWCSLVRWVSCYNKRHYKLVCTLWDSEALNFVNFLCISLGQGGPDGELPWYTSSVMILTGFLGVGMFAIPLSMLTWGFEGKPMLVRFVWRTFLGPCVSKWLLLNIPCFRWGWAFGKTQKA